MVRFPVGMAEGPMNVHHPGGWNGLDHLLLKVDAHGRNPFSLKKPGNQTHGPLTNPSSGRQQDQIRSILELIPGLRQTLMHQFGYERILDVAHETGSSPI